MEILVITGCNLRYNFSAGLSHNAFIHGFCKLGYNVDVLCFSDENIEIDKNIQLPPIRNMYTYNGVSLYEKLSPRNRETTQNKSDIQNEETKAETKKFVQSLKENIKKRIRLMYGVYRMSIVWYRRAKRFKSSIKYDYVVSMSDPAVSHKLASYLLSNKRITANKWIQLWEDPWCDSYYGEKEINIPCMREEDKLLRSAQEVVYVTPLTLARQQNIFPEYRDKMRWCPLAAYYKTEVMDYSMFTENHYGYFGDYFPDVRDLRPFYNVAVNRGLSVDICGSPSDLFLSNGKVRILPRLPLGELKKHEDQANIVICLFNIGGGQVPGKIYQLAATNKTVLAILDGSNVEKKTLIDYFGKYNRFVFCENNEQSISEAIDKIENNELGSISNDPIDAFAVDKVARILLGE